MAETAYDLDHNCIWDFASRIKIFDQVVNTCLVEFIRESNGVNELVQ